MLRAFHRLCSLPFQAVCLATLLGTALISLIVTGCAHDNPSPQLPPSLPASSALPNAQTNPAVRAEAIRTVCIQNRRLICGKVLKIVPGGLVIDSGYTDLLRPPLPQSWLIPGTVTVTRTPATLELNEPGTPCVGLIYLTDLPKRPKAKALDYVVIMGYPAGHYDYQPVPGIKKRIRTFATGLDSAVKLAAVETETTPESSSSVK